MPLRALLLVHVHATPNLLSSGLGLVTQRLLPDRIAVRLSRHPQFPCHPVIASDDVYVSGSRPPRLVTIHAANRNKRLRVILSPTDIYIAA